jgi:hypothetical protein
MPPVYSMMDMRLPSDYGYVLLTGTASGKTAIHVQRKKTYIYSLFTLQRS